MVHVPVRIEFPGMRQNERRIRFFRVGGTVNGLGQRRAEPFCRLVGNFYSRKREKIPTGMGALGDWLGCCVLAAVWSLSSILLFDPRDCSTPGFPLLLHFPEFAQAHVS